MKQKSELNWIGESKPSRLQIYIQFRDAEVSSYAKHWVTNILKFVLAE
ncbi:MAG: hypothetical protein PHO08_01445 [Methylococcales bacterium]|nr:hypothetical protein [Methylococcales bacterium]MDD5631974.1 hypothetical protein [Methylococcales bacterium]